MMETKEYILFLNESGDDADNEASIFRDLLLELEIEFSSWKKSERSKLVHFKFSFTDKGCLPDRKFFDLCSYYNEWIRLANSNSPRTQVTKFTI